MAPFWALSRLPMRVLYVLSDIIWLLVYHVVRYRRRLVRRQLRESFPEKEEGEINLIERRFYHFLCDYFMETLKLISMPHEEILRRVRFFGLNEGMDCLLFSVAGQGREGRSDLSSLAKQDDG